MNKLLNYQIPHFYQLKETIQIKDCVLDASDTGTGKTYVALALAKELKLNPFIICPKSVISTWLSCAKFFNIKLFGIANYELLKGAKYYYVDDFYSLEKMDCQYMEKYEEDNKINFKFNLPSDTLVIFDEAHRCKNHKTVNSKLLDSISKSYSKILLLSATISDKIDCFKPFGTVFKLYDKNSDFRRWMRLKKKSKKIQHELKLLDDGEKEIDIINSSLFPNFGSRMRIKELGSLFPKNKIISQLYTCINKDKIQRQYELIQEAFNDLKNKETKAEALGKLIRARMKIEMYKVPIMLDLIQEGLDSNYSVVVFVNYRETMEYLAHYLDCDLLINGDQSLEDREYVIKQFQQNKKRILISIIQAGGVGISLHDIHGNHPRMSVISPTWSGQDMKQVFGRIHRAKSQSPAIQKLVYCAGTYEDEISKLIEQKLKNISGINDNDLVGSKIPIQKYREVLVDGKKIYEKF
ncbi:MAG: hypothetical protein CMF62_04130 [Magnetococcales bacterium]|nr:hypothetical protein [Magnetococcales bacterium]|tara:strand:- start:18671 stop:20068 length:1398 start_codon:yes stop_codon:yes gene_type:complete